MCWFDFDLADVELGSGHTDFEITERPGLGNGLQTLQTVAAPGSTVTVRTPGSLCSHQKPFVFKKAAAQALFSWTRKQPCPGAEMTSRLWEQRVK